MDNQNLDRISYALGLSAGTFIDHLVLKSRCGSLHLLAFAVLFKKFFAGSLRLSVGAVR